MPRLLACALLVLVGGCGPDPAAPSPTTDAGLEQARVYLDTDRPWGAARLFRDLDASDLSAEGRLLAARAAAGAGDWPRVGEWLGGLDSLGARALYLRARADDHAGDLGAALAGYDAFLAQADGALEVEADAARLRRALVQVQRDPRRGMALADGPAISADWRTVLEAEALAQSGHADRVEDLAGQVTGAEPVRRMWAARIEAARQSGDLTAARRLADRARQSGSDAARAQFTVAAAALADEMGDGAQARALYRQAIETAPASPAARRAAAQLRQGTQTPADWLALAQTDRALGLNGQAADAFRQWLDAGAGDAGQQADVRYQAADALFDAQRYDEVEAVLAPIRTRTDARELWAGTLSRQGKTAESAAVYLDLADADPLPNLYFAADALQQGGDVDQATPLYRRIVQNGRATVWAGLATMRLASLAFQDGEFAQAARLWNGYPGGRDALAARYWAGRAHAAAGDSAAATARFRGVLRAERDSYYALLASQALGEPFWPLPMSPSPPPDPAAASRVAQAFRGVDALREAGFPEVAQAEVGWVIESLGRDQAVRYALAEALVERGYGQRAIRIGLSLGGGTNERRLRIQYPFPFRQLVAGEARDNGLDPFVAAALIRQESQFSTRATSYVGARGLMQLMPATGRTLAGEVGIDDWDPAMLYLPEVNVHLGTRYVGQQTEAYEGSLPAVFAAYNAGPHQVDAWSQFPEFGDDALFAERIPFRETRDYVKILTRNRAIYAGLYGSE